MYQMVNSSRHPLRRAAPAFLRAKPALVRALPALFAALLAACAVSPTTDWPTYGRDRGGQRHSPLTAITPQNVAQLQVAWTYHLRPADLPVTPGRNPFAASEATPVVVGNRLYLTTPFGRVVALDATTGKELWSTVIPGPGQPSTRGLEYWAGTKTTAPRLFFGTRDGRLYALEAATGALVSGFGTNGVVELKTPEVLQGAQPRFYGLTSPPIVYRDLILTGAAVQEFPALGVAGDVRAWDARTGELRWTFHSIPREGEPGFGTWGVDGGKKHSGVNVWGFITVDEARGIAYLPFGAPAFDRYGGDRPGDNLFGTSLVAVNANTGQYLWHFQVVHHDIWDNDLQAPPVLFDLPTARGKRPAVAITSKNGLLFVLDRVTGKPLLPVEERPVPPSDVPGELAAATQPFPVNTPPLARTTFDPVNDIAKVTPELEAWCRQWMTEQAMVAGGLYVPVRLQRNTISFPGLQGGGNWGGSTYDAARGLLFVNTSDLGQVTALVPSAAGAPLPYERAPGGGRFMQASTKLMCQAPPWGQLHAVDVKSGQVKWSSVLGRSDQLPADKAATGRPNVGGAISTASGLVFIGATDDARFRAFDAATGAELWTWRLPASAHATPITYAGSDGEQYVAITATGGSFIDSPVAADTLVAFKLPSANPGSAPSDAKPTAGAQPPVPYQAVK